MTAADQQLLAQANSLCRWDYAMIDKMIPLAESDEAAAKLSYIQKDLYDLCVESL